MRGKTGDGVSIRDPGDIDNAGTHTRERDRRRPYDGVVRSGKAKDAVSAAGLAGYADRQIGGALAAMQAEFKAGLNLARLRREIKSAQYDEQALCSNGVSGDDADQRPPQAPGFYAETEQVPPSSTTAIMETGSSKVNRLSLERPQAAAKRRGRRFTSAACA